MLPLKKTIEDSSLDYSFLFSKLEQLSKENSRYRNAFLKIEDVANKFAAGNLSARVPHTDELDKLSPVFSAINKAYDFTDSYIRKSEILQQAELKNQDEFRKAQLKELKDYFEKQIVHVLR